MAEFPGMGAVARGIREATGAVLMEPRVWKATKYISPKYVVRATIRRSRGKVSDKWFHRDIVLTLGCPNYIDRIFIKDCLKAGEKFPVKKVQLKLVPVPCVSRKKRR